jgi:hypothetical protein
MTIIKRQVQARGYGFLFQPKKAVRKIKIEIRKSIPRQ